MGRARVQDGNAAGKNLTSNTTGNISIQPQQGTLCRNGANIWLQVSNSVMLFFILVMLLLNYFDQNQDRAFFERYHDRRSQEIKDYVAEQNRKQNLYWLEKGGTRIN